jgi:hypothetical protein
MKKIDGKQSYFYWSSGGVVMDFSVIQELGFTWEAS